MNGLRATPILLLATGLALLLFPGWLLRHKDGSGGLLGFVSSMLAGLVAFAPAARQPLAARVIGMMMLATGGWMLAAFQGAPAPRAALAAVGTATTPAGIEADTAGKAGATAEEVTRQDEVASGEAVAGETGAVTPVSTEAREVESPAVPEAAPAAEDGERATPTIRTEVEEIIATTGVEEAATNPAEDALLAATAADGSADAMTTAPLPIALDEAAGRTETGDGEAEPLNAHDPTSVLREKPIIPDEPSPFMEVRPVETPKPAGKSGTAPRPAAKPPAPAAARPGPRGAAQPAAGSDPFSAAKTGAPAAATSSAPSAPQDAPAVESEEPAAGPPAEPNPKRLAEADELLKKAKMMWELEEFDASLKLAEKARKLRASQLGTEDPKVREVDGMIEAAKAKLAQ